MQRFASNKFSRSRLCRCFVSELLGTFILVFLTLSSIACATVAGRRPGEAMAAALMSTIGSGFGLMVAIYVTFGVSGGHINPVVTVALLSIGHIGLPELLTYQTAQYLGGFLGAGGVYFLYSPLFDQIDGGKRVAFGQNGTASVFVTMPNPGVGIPRAIADQILTSAIFIFAVLSIVDPRNVSVPRYLQPMLIALSVTGIVQCTYMIGGPTLNTARDFSPRVLAYMVGYGGEVFTARSFGFWLPLIGPQVGGIAGAWLYQVLIGWPLQCINKQQAEQAEEENEMPILEVDFENGYEDDDDSK